MWTGFGIGEKTTPDIPGARLLLQRRKRYKITAPGKVLKFKVLRRLCPKRYKITGSCKHL